MEAEDLKAQEDHDAQIAHLEDAKRGAAEEQDAVFLTGIDDEVCL